MLPDSFKKAIPGTSLSSSLSGNCLLLLRVLLRMSVIVISPSAITTTSMFLSFKTSVYEAVG